MNQTQVETQGQKERRLGAAFGLISMSCSLVSKLLLVPIILHFLNRAEFGLYQLIGSFVGYLALIDFGISGTLGRFVAKYQAMNDHIRQDNVIAMCLIIYSLLAVILGMVGWFLYNHLDEFFGRSLTMNELADAKIMFVILIGSVCATVLSRAFIGVNAGHERFVVPRLMESIGMLAKIAVVAAVLAMGSRAIGIVAVEAVVNLLILLLNVAYAIVVLKVRFRIHYWDWTLLTEVLSFAFWTFLAAMVVQINFRWGNVLLGATTSTGMVAVYAVAIQVNGLYNTVPTVISSVFLPQVTRFVVNGASGTQLTHAVIGPSRYQLMLLGCILSGFVLFGRQFLTLWAGREYGQAWGAALFIIVPVTIPLCQNTILSVLYAKMLNRGRALITLTFAIINGAATWFLIPVYGVYGPALATGMALLIGHGLCLNLYYQYRVKLNMRLFFKKVYHKIFWVIVFSSLIGTAFVQLPVGDGWLGLAVRSTLFAIFYSITMWLFGMHENERAFFRSICYGGLQSVALYINRQTGKMIS